MTKHIKSPATLIAGVKIEFQAQVTEIAWAYVLSVDGADLVLVRKSTFGPEVAKGVAERILELIVENQG